MRQCTFSRLTLKMTTSAVLQKHRLESTHALLSRVLSQGGMARRAAKLDVRM